MTNLRVAYLLLHFPYLTETFIADEIRALQEQGVDVEIISLLAAGSGPVQPNSQALLPAVWYAPDFHEPALWWAQCAMVGRHPLRYFGLLWRLLCAPYPPKPLAALAKRLAIFLKAVATASHLRGHDRQLLHAHFAWLPGVAAWVVARLLGLPYTVTVHAYDLFAKAEFVPLICGEAAQVIAISEYNRRHLQQRGCRAPISVIHCGICPDAFRGAARSATGDPLGELDASADNVDPLKLLSVGSLMPKKGHRDLIAACALLRDRGIPITCSIIGGGPEEAALRAQIAAAGLQEQVHLLGPLTQPAVLAAYRRHDIFVLPAVEAPNGDRDGIPVVLMEAGAMGLPLVSTAVSGIPELVRQGESGCLAPPGNPLALADAIAALAAEPARRATLGHNARDVVINDFAITPNTAQLAARFHDIVGGAPPPRVAKTGNVAKGKRVLMLLENNPYCQDIRVRREAEALHEAGYQVTVACPQPAGGRWREVTPSGIVLYQFPAPIGGHGALGYLWEYSYTTLMFLLLALLIWCREGFDILHAHNPPDTLFVVPLLFKPFGVRFVYDHHDLAPEIFALRFGARRGAWLHKILLLLERITCRLADQVIATNQSYRAIELERDHVPAGHVTIVRNGPDLNRLHLVPPDPMLRQRARTILCYVGIMGPQDGVDYLLRALHELVYTCNRRDIFCVCIGKGDTIPALRALAQELRIEPYLWFTGWIPDADLLCYLSTADIGLDPDPSNPFNDRSTMIKMMEYMAMGKPIVAFDLPEHHITAADAALYAQPNDVRDFARQIAALIDDSDRRRHMGGIGQQRIAQQFAWPYQAQQLLRAYAALDSQRH